MTAFLTSPLPMPAWAVILIAGGAYALGSTIAWALFAPQRKVLQDLRDAKDAGELADVKDEVDGD